VFSEHESLVTSLALVDDVEAFGGVFLLSAGWDRRICIWNLTYFTLFSVCNNQNPSSIEEAETASVGSIHDMDYSPHLKYFAYASSDMCVYVRKFSSKGSEMQLMYTLKTNLDSEVTCIRWNFITNQWVTGMENGEIRIWVSNSCLDHLKSFVLRKPMENLNKQLMSEEVYIQLQLMMFKKHF
jgi:WD40 repeat protein